jgi:glycine oxidase
MFQPDVIVVGGGAIGLACAVGLGGERLRVLLVSSSEPGVASSASAGILAPSVAGEASSAARLLALESRDMYREYVSHLESQTGVKVPLDLSGILEVPPRDMEPAARAGLHVNSEWLDGAAIRVLEPLLAPCAGAAFHPNNGAVDPVALLKALLAAATRNAQITMVDARVTRIDARERTFRVHARDHAEFEAPRVVLAAGAWVASIAGLPRPLPVFPARGQMIAFDAVRLRHVVMGPRGYIVPRGNRLLVGSTMEHVGLDAGVTADGAELLRSVGSDLIPELAARKPIAQWAGLRPMTPDSLPIVGEDPQCAGLFYACGHSKNGLLLAPITARAITDLVVRGRTILDLEPWTVSRFAAVSR